MPTENSSPQFLQIYFIDGDEEIQVNVRMGIVEGLHQSIVEEIQNKLHQSICLHTGIEDSILMCISKWMENYSISILENQRPSGEHVRRYNAPETKEVGILMPNDRVGQRDIILRERDNNLKRICEFHSTYDALHAVSLPFSKRTHGWSLNLNFLTSTN